MKNKILWMLVLGLFIPVLVNASWWNPFSWFGFPQESKNTVYTPLLPPTLATTTKTVVVAESVSQLQKTYDQTCKEFYGADSIDSGKDNNGASVCGCKNGYNWSKDGKSCKTYNQSCKESFGSSSVYSGKRDSGGSLVCDCKDGYEWSSNEKFCQRTKQEVKATPQTNQDSQASVNTTAETLARDTAIKVDDDIIKGYGDLANLVVGNINYIKEFLVDDPTSNPVTILASNCLKDESAQLITLQKIVQIAQKDKEYLQSQSLSFFLNYKIPNDTYGALSSLPNLEQTVVGSNSKVTKCLKTIDGYYPILLKQAQSQSSPKTCGEAYPNEIWDGTISNGKYNCVCQAGYVRNGASCQLSFSQQQRQPEPRAVENAVQINELKLQYQACRKNPIPLVFQNAQCDKIASQINALGGRL